MTELRVRRVRDAPQEGDGARILVDRLWPRGVSKQRARLDGWCRDVAPSDELRRAFHAGELDEDAFRARYEAELDREPDAVAELRAMLAGHPRAVLLHDSRLERGSNADVLRDWLEAHPGDGTRP